MNLPLRPHFNMGTNQISALPLTMGSPNYEVIGVSFESYISLKLAFLCTHYRVANQEVPIPIPQTQITSVTWKVTEDTGLQDPSPL